MNSLVAAVFLLSLIAAETPKMATTVPPEVTTPDRLETRLGTLEFFDGLPAPATAEKLYDNLDFVRGVEVFLSTLPGASLYAMREGLRTIGVDNQSVAIFETLVDAKSLLLMPDRESVYLLAWIDLHDGPMVVETSPKIVGFIDDFWSQPVTEIGFNSPDRGRGGKYLLVPPGMELESPKGYFEFRSRTFGNWIVARAPLVNGDPAPAVESFKKKWRQYPLVAQGSSEPPPTRFINASTMAFSTIAAGDFHFFEHVNTIVQEESNDALDPDTVGLLASIGIEKGKRFAPDERMKKTLADAAAVGNATARAIVFANRDKSFYLYPDSTWEVGFLAANHQFLRGGMRLLDARTRYFYSSAGTTPGMGVKSVGKGSQYVVNVHDANGAYLDGGKSYRLHLPPKVPAKISWSIAVYDSQTRSALQTDAIFPQISSLDKGLKTNQDGSVDIYFGPTPPEGLQSNWIQTIPGKGWTTVLRLYEPQVPFFEKSWRPGEIEPVG